MKARTIVMLVFFIATSTMVKAKSINSIASKDPVVMEAITKYTTIAEALSATKAVLLLQQFIIQGEMAPTSFTAKRTTGAEADYYIADVSVSLVEGKAKVTITFVKIGTGLLKLSKVADEVKAKLEAP